MKRRRFFPAILGVALLTLPLRAGVLEQLSDADQKRVLAGEQVMLTEALEGYPWPRVRVYQRVGATPREVAAVFCDYNNARAFVPNCLQSKVSREIAPATKEVDYLIDVPILADEAYTARNEVSRGKLPDSYAINWRVVKATSILESAGSLRIDPHGAESILCYTNLVKPSSAAAGLLKGVALGQMRDTVAAIVRHVEKTKAKPTQLAAAVKELDTALSE